MDKAKDANKTTQDPPRKKRNERRRSRRGADQNGGYYHHRRKQLKKEVGNLQDDELKAARKRYKEELTDLEEDLKKQWRREEDQELIELEKRSHLESLVDREIAEESKDIETIRKEEKTLIGTTLWVSMAIILLFSAAALVQAEKIGEYAAMISQACITYFGWFYLLASFGIIMFLFYLALSNYGNVVLGEPDEKPEFDNLSWYAMLFSAGMGVGLLFWGGAEPILHYINPPVGEGRTPDSANMAFVYSAFHWGFHGWGIYCATAVAVAYFGFRKRKKYLISSSIVGLFPNPKHQYWLKVIADITATLAVIFGMAASLGMGLTQIGDGLNYVYELPTNTSGGYIVIMVLITAAFLTSACTGLDKGIKILSNLNMFMAVVLMIFVFCVGPTMHILNTFTDSLGRYISNFFTLSFQTQPLKEGYMNWMGDWTIVYFTWWIAWAPFVGIFLARISKGRTIRELVLSSMIIPTIFTVAWFATFGGSAVFLEHTGAAQIADAVDANKTTALFLLLKQFPIPTVTCTLALILLFVFLVTSADSACYVIAMMTSEGDLDPSIKVKLSWGIVLASVTLILVLGGGVKAINASSQTFAFPFTVILFLMVLSIMTKLKAHVKMKRL